MNPLIKHESNEQNVIEALCIFETFFHRVTKGESSGILANRCLYIRAVIWTG